MNYSPHILNVKDFNFPVVINTNHIPMKRDKFKNITNTSCIIVWHNTHDNNIYYFIQKRSSCMNTGANKLAVAGGMLEIYDETLQHGAIREMLEESQLVFKNSNNMSIDVINKLTECLFLISCDNMNVTFFMLIVSKKQPIWKGPISINKYPFKKSLREVDIIDTSWGDNIKKGHCFMTSKTIIQYMKNKTKPAFWKYSSYSLKKVFKLFM